MKKTIFFVKRIVFALLVMITLLPLSLTPKITFALENSRTFYISPVGNDTNAGNFNSPFKTFSKANSVLLPGDKLLVFGGTYRDKLSITKNGEEGREITISSVDGSKAIINSDGLGTSGVYVGGNYINIENLEFINADGVGIDVKGSNIKLKNLKVSGSHSHAVNFRGTNGLIENSNISGNVLENQGNRGKWGSGVKVSLGGNNITIRNNTVTRNWGEGIAATRGSNVVIEGNNVQDNFSANIYVDNSYEVNVSKNFVTCTANSGYERDGQRAKGIMLGEESYDGWGAKLNNINIVNNIVAYCFRGISFYSAEVSNAGLRNSTIAFNTLYGNTTYSLYIAKFPETTNSLIANNIVGQPEGKTAFIEDRRGIQMNNNFWINGLPAINARGENDKSGDVKFLKTPDYTSDSFKIGVDSPAINSGAELLYVPVDFVGNPRIAAGISDMGAIEFQPPSTGLRCPPLPRQYCMTPGEESKEETIAENTEVIIAEKIESRVTVIKNENAQDPEEEIVNVVEENKNEAESFEFAEEVVNSEVKNEDTSIVNTKSQIFKFGTLLVGFLSLLKVITKAIF